MTCVCAHVTLSVFSCPTVEYELTVIVMFVVICMRFSFWPCLHLPLCCRELGLDLVPRREFSMVDPDEISVTELYRLVSALTLVLHILLWCMPDVSFICHHCDLSAFPPLANLCGDHQGNNLTRGPLNTCSRAWILPDRTAGCSFFWALWGLKGVRPPSAI